MPNKAVEPIHTHVTQVESFFYFTSSETLDIGRLFNFCPHDGGDIWPHFLHSLFTDWKIFFRNDLIGQWFSEFGLGTPGRSLKLLQADTKVTTIS